MSEAEADDPQIVMPPKEAARRLGVASSTLRRLAPTYEAVHGLLPWEGDEAGGGRLWPGEAVERVQAARALVAEGRAKSLESALHALARGAPPPSGVLARPNLPQVVFTSELVLLVPLQSLSKRASGFQVHLLDE